MFAALLPPKPGLVESMGFMLAGFLLVMIILALMWFGTAAIGKIFIFLEKRDKEAARRNSVKAEEERQTVAAAAAVAAVTSPSATGGSDAQLVAVIAAAAQVTLGSHARVVSIRTAENEWGAEGRRQIFASHRTR